MSAEHADIPPEAASTAAEAAEVMTARRPEDLLAVVPYRLGFHPRHSLVVLALHGPRRRFGFTARVDLPPRVLAQEVARYLLEVLRHQGCDAVLLVAYAESAADAQPLVRALRDRLEGAGMPLVDALRSDGRRWYSLTCAGPCCPAEGTPYDLTCHPFAARHVLRGRVALPDREALREQVAAVRGNRRAVMQDLFHDAERGLGRGGPGRGATGGPDVPGAPATGPAEHRAHLCWVRGFVESWTAAPRAVTDDEVAALAVRVAGIPARDTAWSLMSRANAATHLRLWQQVLTRVVPPYEPAVACLTAFAAWLDGNGALAWCAVERALAADPEYSWADLIVQSLERALPPTAWEPPPLEEVERRLG